MSNDPEYEVHPLDRDYSDDESPKRAGTKSPIGRELEYDPTVRKGGTYLLVGCLIVVFLSAIALSNLRGATSAESIAGLINRVAMFGMLVGAIAIFVSYRLDFFRQIILGGSAIASESEMRLRSVGLGKKGSYIGFVLRVLFWYLVLAAVIYLISPTSLGWLGMTLFLFLCSSVIALMITMSIWNRGMTRAFAIGTLTGFLINSFWMGAAFGYGRRDSTSMLITGLGVSFATGLVCAGYVCILEYGKEDDVQNASKK